MVIDFEQFCFIVVFMFSKYIYIRFIYCNIDQCFGEGVFAVGWEGFFWGGIDVEYSFY